MLLSREQIEEILDIIKRRHDLFVFKTVGEEFLTEDEIDGLRKIYGDEVVQQVEDFMRDGYYAGYLRNKDLGTVTNISHEQFRNMDKPDLNELEQYSLEHGKEVVDSYIQKLDQSARTSFEQLIQQYNKQFKDYIATNPGIPAAILASESDKNVGDMVIQMRDLTGNMAQDFEKTAKTEMTNIINIGMVDNIVRMNEGEKPEEIYVFKRVVNDAALCIHCRRLHLSDDGVTPRIYTLAEMLANGSNVGRKANDWKFTVGAVHTFCRCQLVQLPRGYFFDETGKMIFVGEKEANKKVEDQE